MNGLTKGILESAAVLYLYPTVAPVCHNDVAVGVHSHTSGGVELAVPLAMRAKLKQELPVSTVHLQEEGEEDGALYQRVDHMCRTDGHTK